MSSNRENSKAQHSTVAQSPLHKAANQARADQGTYIKKYVRTCMLCPVLFSRSMEMLAFASRLYAPKMLDRPLKTSFCHSNPFFLASECSVGTARYAKRLVHIYEYIRSTYVFRRIPGSR